MKLDSRKFASLPGIVQVTNTSGSLAKYCSKCYFLVLLKWSSPRSPSCAQIALCLLLINISEGLSEDSQLCCSNLFPFQAEDNRIFEQKALPGLKIVLIFSSVMKFNLEDFSYYEHIFIFSYNMYSCRIYLLISIH